MPTNERYQIVSFQADPKIGIEEEYLIQGAIGTGDDFRAVCYTREHADRLKAAMDCAHGVELWQEMVELVNDAAHTDDLGLKASALLAKLATGGEEG